MPARSPTSPKVYRRINKRFENYAVDIQVPKWLGHVCWEGTVNVRLYKKEAIAVAREILHIFKEDLK